MIPTPSDSHHLDSCLIIEILLKTNGKCRLRCEKYIYDLVSFNGQPILALSAIGEIITSIYQKVLDIKERESALSGLLHLFDKFNFDFCSLDYEALEIIKELKEIDPLLRPTDAQLIACTIQRKARSFATLEKRKFIQDSRLGDYIRSKSVNIIVISDEGIFYKKS